METAVGALKPTKPLSNAADVPQVEKPNTSKFVKMSIVEYILYTDREFEQGHSSFFEHKHLGTIPTELSKELFYRLLRNPLTSMISIAKSLHEFRYPSKYEVDSMERD